MWYESIHITSLNLFGLELQIWGLMLAIGVLAGWFLFDYNIQKKGIKFDSSWLALGTVVSGILGARFLQVIVDFDFYRQNLWEIFYVWEGGLASYGAIIFIFVYFYFYVRKYWSGDKKVFWDATSVSLMFALFFARIGCFLINDHFGKLSHVPWAIMGLGEFRHPITLYYVVNALAIFVVLLFLFIKNKWQGKLVGLMMVLYGLNRTLVDVFFKDFMGDDTRWWLTVGLGILLVLIGLIIMIRKEKVTTN
jgi:phosphatidylglycerol:prolipoprotein diacylglycerol transferase